MRTHHACIALGLMRSALILLAKHHHSDYLFFQKREQPQILVDMHSRKTITIVTSPSTPSKSLPALGASCTSPTTKQAPVYRIEERSRTIYVSSDVDPTQWDTHSLNTIFTLAEISESEQDVISEQSIRRTNSDVDNQVTLSPGPLDHVERRHENVSRRSVFRGRLPGIKSAPLHLSTNTVQQVPNSKPSSARARILFYHKNDPYYGFTNFSPHPVIYKGKKYPTSEHLFQSFKVRDVPLVISLVIAAYGWYTVPSTSAESRRTHPYVL